jgi:hypothetical protein
MWPSTICIDTDYPSFLPHNLDTETLLELNFRYVYSSSSTTSYTYCKLHMHSTLMWYYCAVEGESKIVFTSGATDKITSAVAMPRVISVFQV